MKTFVADDYQVTLMDNGGVKVLIVGAFLNIIIIYNPNDKKHWSIIFADSTEKEENIADFELCKDNLKIIRDAFKVVGKQDLFDKEIVFIDKEETKE